MGLSIEQLREKAMRLPLTPGVYLMKNEKGAVIYVGKAKALKNRVSSYFGSHTNHTQKVIKMVEHVADFDYILTDSEFEALVLECSLIKQYMPKYNILLKDDKGYHYIKITKGNWPVIRMAMQKLNDDAVYLGPYTSAFTVRQTVDEVQKIFRLPQCAKVFPRDIGRGRPCLNYFIAQCSAPCAGKISETEYNEAVEEAVRFIKGNSADAVKDMKARMEEASENLEFEKAARLRDRIQAIQKMQEKQKVVSDSKAEEDVFAFALSGSKSCLMVLRFSEGRLCDSEQFLLETPENLPQARYDVIRNYYSMRTRVPSKILTDGAVEDGALLMEWLTQKRGKKVTITCPQKGNPLRLLEMCRANASEKLAQSMGKQGKEIAALDELAKLLGLPVPPEYIEAYDISHTAGSDNVAGMVVFENARPLKKAYRKFAIKSFDGQDDYGSMAEVISRRLNRYTEEKDSGEGFGRLPDLILLDGGHGQVNAVKPIVEAFGLEIPVFGMVKDGKHRTRAIAQDRGEIVINSSRRAFTLVSNIQEEVHRFSVAFHRKKHAKRSLYSSLTAIEGIGEKKAKLLLSSFKTMGKIKSASAEELEQVKGISKKDAENIFAHFSK